MTREELIYEICPYKSMIDCHSEEPYTHFKCKDCSILMNKWFDDYDKHIIEQYEADINLKDTIREIHDNVAQEMYCKGIDDVVIKIKECVGMDWEWDFMFIEQIAEQLKEGVKNEN